jgi:acid phosphatase
MYQRLLALGLAVGLAFFSTPAALAAEPRNLSTAKAEIDHYLDAGAYDRDLAAVAKRAQQYLEKRIPRGAPTGRKLAIVFDIDETTLSNIDHIRKNDYGYLPVVWDQWVAEGTAPVIAPIKAVYDTAVRGGVTVFFITGRREPGRAGTEKNLRAVGYTTWERIYFKAVSDQGLSSAFKTRVRQQIEAEGYVIIANIGDQTSDLIGGYAEKTFKLPNPLYLAP